MNGNMNRIMNSGGCFHNLHELAKMAIFTKNPRSTKTTTHLKGVDPATQVLNENSPWVPWQLQNAFIFHKTIYDDIKTTFHTGTKGAPAPTPRVTRWSQSEGGPRAHVAGASVLQKRKRPPRPCDGGLGDPNMQSPFVKAAGSRGSQSKGSPIALATGACITQTHGRPRANAVGGCAAQQRRRTTYQCDDALDGANRQEATTPTR